MSVIRVWKYDRVWSVHIKVSYSAVMQQLTRHRSFEFSIESSRAKDLDLDFKPLWMDSGEGRMFSQTEPAPFKIALYNTVWGTLKYINILGSKTLKALGAHKQHYNLPVKPWATVDCIMTGSPYAWHHFFSLRCDAKEGAQSDIVKLANELKNRLERAHEVETEDGLIYGPYLDEPVKLTNIKELLLNSDIETPLRQAITSVGRTSTGKAGVISNANSAYRFVERAYKQRHASVFGHHWVRTPRESAKYGPLVGAMSIRNLLGI